MAKEYAHPREAVAVFAQEMERKLRENDHKGGWLECEPKWLLKRLRQEAGELERALEIFAAGDVGDMEGERKAAALERIRREAADVANFAMMIADVTRYT